MKTGILLTVLVILFTSCSKNKDSSELRPLLLEQLKNTYDHQNWFVPTKAAIEGLTAEQSNWKDSTENHSIGELVSHIVFWSEVNLRGFKGEEMPGFEVDNETTFQNYTEEEWQNLTAKLDSIQSEWQQLTGTATSEQLMQWGSEIANMTAHNAYHSGQIIYIRKRNGWWNRK